MLEPDDETFELRAHVGERRPQTIALRYRLDGGREVAVRERVGDCRHPLLVRDHLAERSAHRTELVTGDEIALLLDVTVSEAACNRDRFGKRAA